MPKGESGYERIENDVYETPIPVTQAILEAELFTTDDVIWDPCCASGQVLRAAEMLGIKAHGSDIRDCGYPVSDFLQTAWAPDGADIVTNPPTGVQGRLGVQFIEHALKLMKRRKGRVIMLLPTDFGHGKTRRHLFGDCPQFCRKYELTDRIRWANLEQKDSGPKKNYAWFVWRWEPRLTSGPQLKYLHGTGT